MTTSLERKLIDSIHVGISDSFVETSNKTGTGNGEAKLYLGQEDSPEFMEFFGQRGYLLNCVMFKKDLVRFMNELRSYYFNPPFSYRGGDELKSLWHERMKMLQQYPSEVISLKLEDQTQIDPPRSYAKSKDRGFSFLRSLPLSHLSKLIIVKYQSKSSFIYELKLVVDMPKQVTSNGISEFETLIRRVHAGESLDVGREIERLKKERIGQEKFRSKVIEECKNTCAFTGVRDATLLVAGHIKPWVDSNEFEKVDPQNGLAFTPTYDKLFNDGYISFTDQGQLILSPLLSIASRESLDLTELSILEIPIKGGKNAKRREYLNFHRQFIFRS